MNFYKEYNIYYKRLGLRKLQDLIIPRILKQSKLSYPRYSVLHIFNNEGNISKEIPILEHVRAGYVSNVLAFNNYTSPLIRKKPFNEKKFIRSLASNDSSFTTVLTNRYNALFRNKSNKIKEDVLIINYSNILEGYKLIERKESKIRQLEGVYTEIFNKINDINTATIDNKEPLNHFIIQPLPSVMLSYIDINKFNKTENTKYYKTFYTPERYFLAELFKSFSAELKDETIFKHIKDLNRINIIFTYGEVATIINLGILLSLNSDYKELDNKNKVEPVKLGKLLHRLFVKMYSSVGYTEEEIGDGKYLDKESEDLADIDSPLKKNIDGDLEDEDTLISNIVNDTNNDKVIHQITDSIESLNTIESIKETNDYKDVKLEEIMSSTYDTESKTLDKLLANDKINKSKHKKYADTRDKFLNGPSPFDKSKSVKDMITVTEDDVKFTDVINIPKITAVNDESAMYDINKALDGDYINNVYNKDMLATVTNINNFGVVVKDYVVTPVKDILGDYYEHNISIIDPTTGIGNTIKFSIPKIKEDGSFMISKNTYYLRKLRADTPIKKITIRRVLLSSAYGKLFIEKSPLKKNDKGFKLYSEVVKSKSFTNVTLGELTVYNTDLPIAYSIFGRYIKAFNYKDTYKFNFEYSSRKSLAGKELKKIENTKYIICGSKGTSLLVMDFNNIVYLYKEGKYEEIGDIYTLLNIEEDNLPNEFSTIKLFKFRLPTVYALCYYTGMSKLLELTNVEYKTVDYKRALDTDDIFIRFLDKSISITPKDEESRMLWEGINNYKKELKNYPSSILNSREELLPFLKDLGARIVEINELKNLEHMYLDAVTISILEQMKEPTTFIGLLLRANELLIDDKYIHPNSIKGITVKGIERIPQMVHKSIVDAFRSKNSKEFFSRSKFEYNPYEVWNTINSDNSKVLIEDINPMAYLKIVEETTATGTFGRAREAMSKSTRELVSDNIGIISESVKDSGDVGISSTMSAVPKLSNVRGTAGVTDDLTFSNILSSSALISPFINKDDGKRANFASIMNSHVIPIANAKVFPVRTGYENVMAYKSNAKFITTAKEKGKVTKVTNKFVTVKYKDSEEKYSIKTWNSKEESNVSFKHTMVSNVVEGDKVDIGDVIVYDSGFFAPDIFNSKQVLYRAGTMIRVALQEVNETDEDASAISSKLSKATEITYISSRSIRLTTDSSISNNLNTNDKVDYRSLLFTIESNLNNTDNFDKKTISLLEGFINTAPRAKHNGKIIRIEVWYNDEEVNLSKSIKKLISSLDKSDTGKVGSNYSINGVPLYPGNVEIKYYIETTKGMSEGDKGIIASQLKTTVSEVREETIQTENGEELDGLFSAEAVAARIVNSPMLMGTTATVLRLASREAVRIYKG